MTGQYVVILTGGALPGDHPAADADPPAHQLDLAIERGTGNDGAPVLCHVAEEAWLLGYKEAAALHRPVAAWVVNGDRETAGRFAEFVSREIDPAYVTAARSPLDEMLRADDERHHPVPSDEVPF